MAARSNSERSQSRLFARLMPNRQPFANRHLAPWEEFSPALGNEDAKQRLLIVQEWWWIAPLGRTTGLTCHIKFPR